MMQELQKTRDYLETKFGKGNPIPVGYYAIPFTTPKGDAFMKVYVNEKQGLTGFKLFWDEAFHYSCNEYVTCPPPEYWNVPDKDGNVNVPDNLVPLLNKVGNQLRFHTISGKNELQTAIDIVYHAERFFNKQKPQP